jgi:methyl-accepting chemotaxis protein
MIKKILLFVLILFICYIVGIFLYPTFIDGFWAKGFNDSVRNLKKQTDEIYTNIPTKDEFKDSTETIIGNISNWFKSLKDWVDNVRENVNDVTEKYEEVKTSVNEAKKEFEEWVDKVKEATDSINEVFSWSINN